MSFKKAVSCGALWLAVAFCLTSMSLHSEDLNDPQSPSDDVQDSAPIDQAAAVINEVSEPDSSISGPPLHPELSLEQRFNKAEWVSLVKVLDVGTLINPSVGSYSTARIIGSNRYMAIQAYNYRAAVMKEWKGSQPNMIKFHVDFTDCQSLLSKEGEYIVFGVVNVHGKYQSMSCEDIIAFDLEGGIPSTLDNMSISKLDL